MAYEVITKLAPGPDGKPRESLYGLAGYNKEFIKVFLSGCAVRADQAAAKPAEQPAPLPIKVERAFQQ